MTQPSLRLGDLFVTVGALLVFAFSFAPFVQYASDVRDAMPAGASGRFSAWTTEIFMVPLTTFVVVAAVLAIVSVWVRFARRRDPHLVGFRLTQLEVGLTLFAFTVLMGMTMSDKYLFFGSSRDEELRGLAAGNLAQLEVGWGAVIMVLGSILALVGTVLNHLGLGPRLTATAAEASAQQPTPPASGPPPVG